MDYASWVEKLTAAQIAEIYRRFSDGDNLDEAFAQRFGAKLDEATLNQSHQVGKIKGDANLYRRRATPFWAGLLLAVIAFVFVRLMVVPLVPSSKGPIPLDTSVFWRPFIWLMAWQVRGKSPAGAACVFGCPWFVEARSYSG